MLNKLIILVFLVAYIRSDAPTPPPPPPPTPATPTTDLPSIKLDEFDVFKDADKLCDELTSKYFKNPKTITKLLCHRSWDQRNQIQQQFPLKCDNRVLLDKIKSITFMMPDCKHLMARLLTAPPQINKEAIEEEKSECNEDDVITQIICAATNKEKTDLANIYPDLQKVLDDYGGKGGEGYKEVLTGVCLKQRKETPDCNVTPRIIETEANELKCKNGPEFVAKLKEVICKYGDPELKQIFIKYQELQQDSDLADKIQKSFQGKEQEAYVVLVRSIQSKYMFYAKLLNHCIKGGELNSNLKCVNRVVVLRCEIDLGNIAENYKSLYGTKFMKDFRDSVKVDHEYFEAISKLFGNYE